MVYILRALMNYFYKMVIDNDMYLNVVDEIFVYNL